MADVNGVLQVEMRRHRGEVIGIVIHVVTVSDLGGAAVAAAVMGDDAIALIEEKQHLCIPVISRQRPAMAEHDGLTFAPILIENLNAVLGRNSVHGFGSFVVAANGLTCGGHCARAGTLERYPAKVELDAGPISPLWVISRHCGLKA